MRVRSIPVFAPYLVVLGLFAACNRQGEGQVCDPRAGNNGDNDCQSGLTCQTIPGAPYATCCPPMLAQATASACGANHTVLDASTAPPDGSLDAEGGTDGGGTDDASVPSSVEASSDAAVEAASQDGSAQGDSDGTFEAMADASEAGPDRDGGD